MMWFLQPGITVSDVIMRILAALVIIFLIMPLHEFSHGFVAYKLGDKSVKYSGRLTLNPMVHFDPLGAFSVLVFDIGWSKPMPIDPKGFRCPKRDIALTALAGPLSNVVAAVVGAVLLNGTAFLTGVAVGLFQKFLSYYVLINISLAAFNFIPVPPLDGYKILECLIPDKYLFNYYKYYPVILLSLMGLMLFGFFDIPLMFIRKTIYTLVIQMGSLPFLAFV